MQYFSARLRKKNIWPVENILTEGQTAFSSWRRRQGLEDKHSLPRSPSRKPSRSRRDCWPCHCQWLRRQCLLRKEGCLLIINELSRSLTTTVIALSLYGNVAFQGRFIALSPFVIKHLSKKPQGAIDKYFTTNLKYFHGLKIAAISFYCNQW